MNYPMTVTLPALRKKGACLAGYNKLVRALQGVEFSSKDEERETYIRFAHKEPVTLEAILANNGLDDALWALRCVPEVDRDAYLFAVWCARQVQHLMTDPRSLNALDVAEAFANGNATEAERDAVGDAARVAAWDAVGAEARAAAWVAVGVTVRATARYTVGAAARAAAWVAVGVTARAAVGDAQKEMFLCMCNGTAPWQVPK